MQSQGDAAASQRAYFVGLDGLRGVAAISVLALHFPDHTFWDIVPGAYLAVDLFFVLSGFVLAHAFEQKLRDGMNWAAFMRQRIIRLYPLYVLGTGALIGLAVLNGALAGQSTPRGFVPTAVLAALFLPTVPAFSSAAPFLYPFNFPAWSLLFELFANALFALAARWLSGRVLVLIIVLSGMLLVCSGLYFGHLNIGWSFENWWGAIGRVLFSFFTGVGMYRLWRAGKLEKFKAPTWAVLGALVGVFAVQAEGAARAWVDIGAALVVFPLLTALGVNARPKGFVALACAKLGAASYAVYVLQIVIIEVLSKAAPYVAGREWASFGVAGSLALACAVLGAGLAANAYYDGPARRFLTRTLVDGSVISRQSARGGVL